MMGLIRRLRTAATPLLLAVGLVFGSAAAVAPDAAAQRYSPGSDRGYDRGPAGGPRTNEAGVFDYYALVLSWSPSYCAGLPRDAYDPQCHRRDGRRYAFVLHGLWPQYERGWPERCASRDNGFVPRAVADQMLDIMPSDKLVFHEYRKHGVCSGLGVDGYFRLSRQLFQAITVPELFRPPVADRLTVSPEEVTASFLKANPKLKPDMIAVACGGPGNRLREVRICFDRSGEPRACGRNEDQRRLCNASRVFVPPVRAGANSPTAPRGGAGSERPPAERKGWSL